MGVNVVSARAGKRDWDVIIGCLGCCLSDGECYMLREKWAKRPRRAPSVRALSPASFALLPTVCSFPLTVSPLNAPVAAMVA